MPRYYHLAQVNIARMRAPIDSELLAGFVALLPSINAAADVSPGFVWRLQSEAGDATAVRAYDDPLVLFNLSVWESVEALRNYSYKGSHVAVFRNRSEWFERPAGPVVALWWIPAGHLPGVAEGVQRLEYQQTHGETPAAFSLSRP